VFDAAGVPDRRTVPELTRPGGSKSPESSLAGRSARRLRRARTIRSGATFRWLLAIVGFLASVGVGWWRWSASRLLETDVTWWMLALAFYLGEWLVVYLRFGRDVHALSMTAVPLVVGLVAVSPVELFAAQAIAAAVFAGARRNQPLVSLVSLVGGRLIQAAAAVAVIAAVPDADFLAPEGWLLLLAAAEAANLVGHLEAFLRHEAVGTTPNLKETFEAIGFGSIVTGLNAGLGILVNHALVESPPVALFALLPAVALFAAYRSYASSRHERVRLKALYEATRDLHASPQIEDSLKVAAAHARDMFESEFCEIVLGLGSNQTAYRTIVGPGEYENAMDPVDPARWASIWSQAVTEGKPFLVDSTGSLASFAGDRRLPITAAMVAPIRAGEEQAGIIVVANPLSDSTVFRDVDLGLLGTLSGQVGVAVENGQLEDSLAALTELKAELQHQALHDGLTGLANRSLFSENVFHAVQLTRRTGGQIAVLFLDLDDFKNVNDSLGHAAGDELLKAVSNLLRSQCRPEDTIARLGGDEFGVLLEDVGEAKDATEVAQRILDAFQAPLWIAGGEVSANASIGVAFGKYGDTANKILRDADAAMYSAKRSGKGTFRLFETNMHAAVVAQLQLRADLEAAIDRQELRLLYQPIVDLSDGSVRGFEALIRWQHPLKGWQSPAAFIPFAEETGLIIDIGRWVLWEAARRCNDWLEIVDSDPAHFEVTVNLSAKQLDTPDIVAEVDRVITEIGVDPAFLVLEITETTMMNAAPDRLDELRKLGVRLAIDDFGTGYSSLASLHKLSVDILKIDREFVQGIADEHDASPFVGTIVGLGEALGLATIVEGIETQEQLERLKELGCSLGQGFYFAKPLAEAQATGLLRRQASGKKAFDFDDLALGLRDRRLRFGR
jgi:diguanylate cyclase (GGDEF)-like protein